MDKSWIDDQARETKAYKKGVNSFLAFAFRNSAVGNKILCPCTKCVNSFWREASEVREHLVCDGFLKGYRTWNLYAKASSSSVSHDKCDVDELREEGAEFRDEDDDISDLLRDLACGLDDRGDLEDDGTFELANEDDRGDYSRLLMHVLLLILDILEVTVHVHKLEQWVYV